VADALPETPPPVLPVPLMPEAPLALEPPLSGEPCTRTWCPTWAERSCELLRR
jgi:hypothetical protein